eukprot:408606-Lingulodinium_polyedra.AAC.1
MAGSTDASDVARCIENWTEIGQWVQSDGRLAARPDAAPDNGRKIVLLSLFDGTGMARVGLDDLLRRIGAEDALHASFFVEINP